jgi:hypothetical protein
MPKTIRVGPSWTEVFLGAFLSLALGVVLAALSLMLRPVVTVKELPKEADRQAGVVYYFEGSRDGNKATMAEAKRKNFVAGQSVTVTFNEDELNILATKAAPPPAAPKPAPKPKAGELPIPAVNADAKVLPPIFRIRDGVMQIAVPTTISIFGWNRSVLLLAKGDFARQDGKFVFEPTSMTMGSCPLDRLPFLKKFALSKLLGVQTVPEDVAASWAKVTVARLEGNELKLTLP